ncbi:MAG: DUF423 domain-containing protein [Planctomycetes bacterium]|nr:DUF423 domain-containing protein [Planctomycetota bacterium]
MNRTHSFRCGAAGAAIAVATGAFGAHALRDRLTPGDLETWELAVRYLMFHALALVAIAALPREGRRIAVASTLLAIGAALFSGTLFVLVLSGARWLGAVTPIGGTLMIAGWVVLATARVTPSSARTASAPAASAACAPEP